VRRTLPRNLTDSRIPPTCSFQSTLSPSPRLLLDLDLVLEPDGLSFQTATTSLLRTAPQLLSRTPETDMATSSLRRIFPTPSSPPARVHSLLRLPPLERPKRLPLKPSRMLPRPTHSQTLDLSSSTQLSRLPFQSQIMSIRLSNSSTTTLITLTVLLVHSVTSEVHQVDL